MLKVLYTFVIGYKTYQRADRGIWTRCSDSVHGSHPGMFLKEYLEMLQGSSKF